ncbi:hypothetical protein Cgig2_027037 [Carnegiea gigantea]|uniref:Exocyst complex subunit Exo70 C-terminal domain-containing protein n=1 Tax=Carnegiea gigantea TaxID=171969 RepID=A0A9Q1QF12_9CARY|nr:hypothetical protein Cgig2_027037 [Carnegiea gigantea]
MAASNGPLKSLSFDIKLQDDQNTKLNHKEITKSYSFASRSHNDLHQYDDDHQQPNSHTDDQPDSDQELTLDQLSQEIHHFIVSLSNVEDQSQQPLQIPNAVAEFLKKLESKIGEYEENSVAFGGNGDADSSFIAAVTRLSSLMEALGAFESHAIAVLNEGSAVLHHAMVFLEEEIRRLLEESSAPESSNNPDNSHSNSSSKNHHHQPEAEGDFCLLPERKSESESGTTTVTLPTFSSEYLSNIGLICEAMIAGGYQVECCNVFVIARRHAFDDELKRQGFDKFSADDVQKMNWETLEGEIATWIRVFKHCSSHLLPGERNFYNSVLADDQSAAAELFSDLSSAVVAIFVNFAEAVAMTKRSTEKLFKFLDMYETLMQSIDGDDSIYSEKELRSELSFAASRLGEAAVSIFCMLENSIKSDTAKTPVPSGAVHPLTRYTMNYLKYACEYKDTLEQVFRQHLKTEQPEDYEVVGSNGGGERKGESNEKQSPFAAQLTLVMDLLDANLEAKSRLYKDPSLRYIFMMNNGRYMLQKVKGSPEIHQVLGDNWCRKRSSDVRQCHKGYQRETWTKVLQCLKHEGLQVNGKVYKPTLKERFKNFNQLFEEIHKTQSTWVVSDEQLQSELRVSISAVMIPAYRSFVARSGQVFTPGRQTQKYIKYQPEDIEGVIEEFLEQIKMENNPRKSSFKDQPDPLPEKSPVLNKSTSFSTHKGSVENHSTPDNDASTVNGEMDEASRKIDALIDVISSVRDKSDLPTIPEYVETFTNMVGSQIDRYIRQEAPLKFGQDLKQDTTLINMVTLLSRLNNLLDQISPDEKVSPSLSITAPVVQRAMAFMEKELRILLQEGSEETKKSEEEETKYPGVNQDTIENVRRIVDAMISGGYHKDCSHAYTSLRKDAFKEAMKHHQGFDDISYDDVQKMQWETLEGHIADWVKVTKHAARVLLPGENNLCVSVFFPDHPSIGETIITNLTKPVVTPLLNLAEAVSLTKKSAERLFKLLDMYEALTDLMAALDTSKCSNSCISELKSDMLVTRRRLRETIIGIFDDLENSIKSDAARSPVPGGGVHPLTRYTINYLGYACDFRETLQHIFFIYQNKVDEDETAKPNVNSSDQSSASDQSESESAVPKKYADFAAELIKIMNLLDDNLEAKSKLYKDPSLRYIFLMNNGRYVLQKIKESSEILEVMGDDFRRKRSSELRGYHKSYQRETWSRVLQCLNQEGLQVNGKVQKTLVKERLKSFNQMLDEIHKTQSAWVVSDKQLQSELRVSISAVMIPAYRSFVARFGQCFGSRKQADKYIKYQPEDIESSIEALFDGNGQNLSMARRRLSFPH